MAEAKEPLVSLFFKEPEEGFRYTELEIRFDFESAVRFDSIRKGTICENFQIESAMFVVSLVKQLRPLTALSGTVYKLASSISDHTPVV